MHVCEKCIAVNACSRLRRSGIELGAQSVFALLTKHVVRIQLHGENPCGTTSMPRALRPSARPIAPACPAGSGWAKIEMHAINLGIFSVSAGMRPAEPAAHTPNPVA